MKNPDSDRLHPNEWDDHFRQRFADFESEPPANALARILADLPTPAPAFNGRRTWLFGGLGLLLLLTGSWFVSQRSWPVSARIMANAPQAQPQGELLAKRSPEITGTVTTRSANPAAAGKVSTEPWPENAPDPSGVSLDNQSIAAYKSHKGEAQPMASPELSSVALSPVNGPEATIGKPRPDPVRIAQPRAIDISLPVPGEAATSAVAQQEVERSKPIAMARLPQPTQRSSQKNHSSDNQIVSNLKSATSAVAPAFEDNSTANKTVVNTIPAPDEKLPSTLQTEPAYQHISLASLSMQPMQPTRLSLPLPGIDVSALPQSAPKQPTVSRQRPVIFVGVMPLYTYQRIDPVQTDDVWITDVKTQSTFSTQRAGLRFQAGVEWPLSRRISLRTSLIYSRLNQQINYSTPSDRPDSVRVERVDEKSVRLIPYYSDKQLTQQINWHYVGAGADFVFHLGQLGAWRHYASVGATAGTYVGLKAGQTTQPLSGFIQGAYGIERQLTPSLWLRIAPTVQYGLTTLTDADGLFMVRPSQFTASPQTPSQPQ
jgi:hypothetical protein